MGAIDSHRFADPAKRLVANCQVLTHQLSTRNFFTGLAPPYHRFLQKSEMGSATENESKTVAEQSQTVATFLGGIY